MMTRSYFSEAMGSFVVFDLQQPLTLVGAKEWKKSLDNTCLQVGGSPIPVILLANKVYIPVHTCNVLRTIIRIAVYVHVCSYRAFLSKYIHNL